MFLDAQKYCFFGGVFKCIIKIRDYAQNESDAVCYFLRLLNECTNPVRVLNPDRVYDKKILL